MSDFLGAGVSEEFFFVAEFSGRFFEAGAGAPDDFTLDTGVEFSFGVRAGAGVGAGAGAEEDGTLILDDAGADVGVFLTFGRVLGEISLPSVVSFICP